MIASCPYCGGPLTVEQTRPPLSKRQTRIYDTLIKAGPDGMATEDLLVRMYSDEEMPTPGGFTVLRGRIHLMNKVLIPEPYCQKIINNGRGCYKLISLRNNEDEAKAPPQIRQEDYSATSVSHSST